MDEIPQKPGEVPFAIIHQDGSTEFCYHHLTLLTEGDKVIFSRIED